MNKTNVEKTPDGVAISFEHETGGHTRYSMQGDQVEKMIRGIDDKSHPFHSVKKGDIAAARDMAHEAKKQIES